MSSTKTFLNLERIARVGQKQHTFHFGTYGQQKLPGVHARELLHTKFQFRTKHLRLPERNYATFYFFTIVCW